MKTKRLRKGEKIRMLDRLSNMPESLQLRILSSLDTRHAIGTSMLSKSWVSSWTCIPVLNFSSNGFKNLHLFDKFVVNALLRRQPMKLDKVTFKHEGKCNEQILEKVFDYAFSHGVKEFEANIEYIKRWPTWLHTSSDSLTSLKLEAQWTIAHCSFLEPRSGSFKNLTSLHLEGIFITNLDPFSGFPVLDKLRLVCCVIKTKGRVLNLYAPQLSEFSILYYGIYVGCCEFKTPKLRYFEWRGCNFPQLKAHSGGSLPFLDTVVIGYDGYCLQDKLKMMFDDMFMLLKAFDNAKVLMLSSSVVHLLALFSYEWENQCSPFQDLKCLKVDFTRSISPKHFEGSCKSPMELSQLVPGVKAYLLQKSHDAKCTIINYPSEESPCSSSQNSMCDTTPTQAANPSALVRPKRKVRRPARFSD